MRNPDRLDSFYEQLKELHKEYVPDWRFGQLIVNYIRWCGDPFFYEEDKMLESFKKFLNGEE